MSKIEGGLGFYDLGKFNIALLAKERWHLMENLESLDVRLLRAKYYCGSNFLKSSLGSCHSLIWRNIWCSKALLMSELRWQIDLGLSVSIWEDYWLPRKIGERIQSNRVEGLETVSDLIISNTNRWDRLLLEDIFTPA